MSGYEKRGLTLLEVLLSTLLFAFVIGGAAAVWRFHELSFQKTRNRNSAHHILKQELDRTTSYPYVHLEEAERDFTLSVTRYVDGVAVDQQFQVTSTITENSQESMKSIALEVTYTERNETRSIAAETKAFRSQ